MLHEECLRKPAGSRSDRSISHQIEIEYQILLSPSYRLPVLYLRIRSPTLEVELSLDATYRYLVPEQYRGSLRNADVGVLGALSMTHHPLDHRPCWFIHPCRTADALRELGQGVTVDINSYLLLWLGLVGPSVGLSISAQSAQAVQQGRL
ncbi:MAG: hypothetical protein M1823_004529 [Watsoniomyces obsoletus]|nr:MAG: hypothetical protein M1823_004529 [Watsoniomyces obsoletus]